MTRNKLKLNDENTEFFIESSNHNFSLINNMSINIGGNVILLSSTNVWGFFKVSVIVFILQLGDWVSGRFGKAKLYPIWYVKKLIICRLLHVQQLPR